MIGFTKAAINPYDTKAGAVDLYHRVNRYTVNHRGEIEGIELAVYASQEHADAGEPALRYENPLNRGFSLDKEKNPVPPAVIDPKAGDATAQVYAWVLALPENKDAKPVESKP
jgi:hypothetical protein